jgi:hypothetical protein
MHPKLLKGATLIMLSECFFVLMGTQIRSVEIIVFFIMSLGFKSLFHNSIKMG